MSRTANDVIDQHADQIAQSVNSALDSAKGQGLAMDDLQRIVRTVVRSDVTSVLNLAALRAVSMLNERVEAGEVKKVSQQRSTPMARQPRTVTVWKLA